MNSPCQLSPPRGRRSERSALVSASSASSCPEKRRVRWIRGLLRAPLSALCVSKGHLAGSHPEPLATAFQQKSLARIARLIAALFLAKSAGSVWLGGVPDFRPRIYRAAGRSQWRDRGRFSRPSVYPENPRMAVQRDSPCQFNCSSRVYAAPTTMSINRSPHSSVRSVRRRNDLINQTGLV